MFWAADDQPAGAKPSFATRQSHDLVGLAFGCDAHAFPPYGTRIFLMRSITGRGVA